ncbi:hypothetical protein [Streptomyces sp. G-G2]|nr:hypothetical protein [Streptomyces sp. G-G2]MDJ0386084.1 hypothetical protein [Streptomyces sp. G-G2]
MHENAIIEHEVRTIEISDEQIEALSWPRCLSAIPADVLARIS